MIRFFKNYLHGRKCSVKRAGIVSQQKRILNGVPQRAILSPSLFSVYINDLPDALPKNVSVSMFADDIIIWTTHEDLNVINRNLQSAITSVYDWARENKMIISSSKTSCQVFTLSTKLKSMELNLKVGKQIIEQKKVTKVLGLLMDSRIRFRHHVTDILERVYKRIRLIKYLGNKKWGCSQDTLVYIYKQYIRPLILYGIGVWGQFISKSTLYHLEVANNHAARSCAGLLASTPIHYIYKETGLSTILELKQKGSILSSYRWAKLPPNKNISDSIIKNRPMRRLKSIASLEENAKTNLKLLGIDTDFLNIKRSPKQCSK